MTIFRSNRSTGFSLTSSLQAALGSCLSSLQQGLMKVAVAVSLQLCLFAARSLLSSAKSTGGQANPSI